MRVEASDDGTDQSLERGSGQNVSSLLLVALNLSQGNCAWSVSVRLSVLHTTFSWGTLLLGNLVLTSFGARGNVHLASLDFLFTCDLLSGHYVFFKFKFEL